MPIVPETFEPVFAHLVGDETKVAAFEDALTESIHAQPDEEPYELLHNSALLQIHNALYVAGLNTKTQKHIHGNAQFSMRLTGGVLRGVGDTYTERARQPQIVDNVTDNTNLALRYLHSFAYDGKVSLANEAAYFRGNNPRNPFSQLLARYLFARNLSQGHARMNTHTFVTEEDQAGQLTLRRRHKMLAPDGLDRCPTADVKVGPADAQRAALWTMMKSMGKVAVTAIFPDRFPIVDSNGELLSTRH
jgi:hypothetical protein